jgi:hypothetical protein
MAVLQRDELTVDHIRSILDRKDVTIIVFNKAFTEKQIGYINEVLERAVACMPKNLEN